MGGPELLRHDSVFREVKAVKCAGHDVKLRLNSRAYESVCVFDAFAHEQIECSDADVRRWQSGKVRSSSRDRSRGNCARPWLAPEKCTPSDAIRFHCPDQRANVLGN